MISAYYGDHSGNMYSHGNDAHHAAYRSFSQSLALVPPLPPPPPPAPQPYNAFSSRASTSLPSDTSSFSSGSPCKTYESCGVISSQTSSSKEATTKSETNDLIKASQSFQPNGSSDPFSSAFSGQHHLPSSSWCNYPPYHAHSQPRPDANSYLMSDDHRNGLSDPYNPSRLSFPETNGSNIYHTSNNTQNSSSTAGKHSYYI